MRRLLFLAVVVSSFLFFSGTSVPDATAQQPDLSQAIAAQERHTPGLLNRPGIVGTGVGINAQGEPVIRVYVTTPAVLPPPALDSIPVEQVVTGRIDAQCGSRTERCRPAPLGVSVGHPNITAGTIGARVTNGDNVYILSNNHVLANSNNASAGDSALQPGPYDGGTNPADKIGALADFVSINFSGGDNTMDAAIASTTTAEVKNATFSGYKPSKDVVQGTINLPVKKDGRTTGLTTGAISAVNVTVNVCYEARGPFMCVKVAKFVNQLEIEADSGNFSAGGDSGSLIVTQSGDNPVGLLFAGGGSKTFANRIDLVLQEFGVSIDDSTDEPSGEDTTAPETAITSAPTDPSNSTSATFEFTSNESGSTFECSLDEIAFATCTSPKAYSGLSDGSHTFRVRATDEAGNTDQTPATYTWMIDTAPAAGISLSVTGYKVRGVQAADLTWSGATSTSVDVYRNGAVVTTTANDGTHMDNIGVRGGGSYTYKVCEAGIMTACSNEVTIIF